MAFWDQRVADARNIRHFRPGLGWCRYDDVADENGRTVFSGSRRDIDQALSAALNSSNLLLLTGAGSSFCARNETGQKNAPGMSDLWDAVESRVTRTTLSVIIELIPKAKGIGKNIEKLMTLAKIYVSLFDDKNSKMVSYFIEGAEEAILERVDFVTHQTDLSYHKNLVRKIARRGVRKPRAKVFTTNYDLCFEVAARGQRFIIVDGFSHSVPQFYDRSYFSYDTIRRGNSKDGPDYVENVFHLYKLHGSIDWRRNGREILRSKLSSDGTPVLIYPRDTKYQEAFEAPYLDMMSAFQTSLREPDTALIVSGFGFNDDHLSKPVMAAIEGNMSLRLIICDVTFLTDSELEKDQELIVETAPMRTQNEYFKRFFEISRHGDPRITLLSGRFEDLTLAVPDLVAQTERERHAERMQTVLQGLGGR